MRFVGQQYQFHTVHSCDNYWSWWWNSLHHKHHHREVHLALHHQACCCSEPHACPHDWTSIQQSHAGHHRNVSNCPLRVSAHDGGCHLMTQIVCRKVSPRHEPDSTLVVLCSSFCLQACASCGACACCAGGLPAAARPPLHRWV